ncbi:xylulokinase, partial [human gut metagenome]
GTSVFAMIVLEKALKNVHTEIDLVTTPSGEAVAMAHCNNCTSDLNAWVNLFEEFANTYYNKESQNAITDVSHGLGIFERLRMEIEHYLMAACFHVQRTQNIVHSAQLSRLSINRSRPARIVNLREYDHAALARLHLVSQVVRLILRHLHHRSIILLHALRQLFLEFGISHSHMSEVHLAHAIDFLVGIVHILHLIYEPCIAVGIRILNRNGLSALQRHDEVFGIQHVQYRIDTVAVHLGHIAACSSYRLHRLLHLRSDM